MRLYPLAHLWDWLCALGRATRWAYRWAMGWKEPGPTIKRGPEVWP